MSKSIQLKNINNEKIYPHPYYPVGSIYLSINDTNPSKWFGGTWKQIAKGRTLVGVDTNDTDFNTVKKTGGNKTIDLQHTHTSAPHNHGRGNLQASINIEGGCIKFYHDNSEQPVYNYTEKFTFTETKTSGTLYGGTRVVGNTGKTTPSDTGSALSKSQVVLQPYFTCYIWCRTA